MPTVGVKGLISAAWSRCKTITIPSIYFLPVINFTPCIWKQNASACGDSAADPLSWLRPWTPLGEGLPSPDPLAWPPQLAYRKFRTYYPPPLLSGLLVTWGTYWSVLVHCLSVCLSVITSTLNLYSAEGAAVSRYTAVYFYRDGAYRLELSGR